MRASQLTTSVLSSVLMIVFTSVSLFGGKLLPNPLYTPDPSVIAWWLGSTWRVRSLLRVACSFAVCPPIRLEVKAC